MTDTWLKSITRETVVLAGLTELWVSVENHQMMKFSTLSGNVHRCIGFEAYYIFLFISARWRCFVLHPFFWSGVPSGGSCLNPLRKIGCRTLSAGDPVLCLRGWRGQKRLQWSVAFHLGFTAQLKVLVRFSGVAALDKAHLRRFNKF